MTQSVEHRSLTAPGYRGLWGALMRDSRRSNRRDARIPTVGRPILSDILIGAIERDGIEIDGQTYRIEIVKVQLHPEPPLTALAVTITVQAERSGRPCRVTCRVSLQSLNSESYIAAFVRTAIRKVLTGVLPSDSTEYL